MRFFTVIQILMMISCYTFSQDQGSMFITHYSAVDYGGDAQNWDILKDQNGILYVANNKGVLEYDGVKWRKIPVPTPVVRSLAIDKKNTIYLGAKSEFGYLAPDSLAQLTYVSLLDKIDTS